MSVDIISVDIQPFDEKMLRQIARRLLLQQKSVGKSHLAQAIINEHFHGKEIREVINFIDGYLGEDSAALLAAEERALLTKKKQARLEAAKAERLAKAAEDARLAAEEEARLTLKKARLQAEEARVAAEKAKKAQRLAKEEARQRAEQEATDNKLIKLMIKKAVATLPAGGRRKKAAKIAPAKKAPKAARKKARKPARSQRANHIIIHNESFSWLKIKGYLTRKLPAFASADLVFAGQMQGNYDSIISETEAPVVSEGQVLLTENGDSYDITQGETEVVSEAAYSSHIANTKVTPMEGFGIVDKGQELFDTFMGRVTNQMNPICYIDDGNPTIEDGDSTPEQQQQQSSSDQPPEGDELKYMMEENNILPKKGKAVSKKRLKRQRQKLKQSFIEASERYFATLKKKIRSSAEAKNFLTLKMFDTRDKTLNGWNTDVPHSKMLKWSFESDSHWTSGFSKSYRQLMDIFTMFGLNQMKWDLNYDDVIFVQALKDAQGREVVPHHINRGLIAMGYAPVTPGFFIKLKNDDGTEKPLARWMRCIFGTNKELRSRARGATTTPWLFNAGVNQNGEVARFFVTDFERCGQKGADGGNEYSWDLVTELTQPVAQIRAHTPYFNVAEDNESVDNDGFQIKGKTHAADAWISKFSNNKYYRVTEDMINDDPATYKDIKKISAHIIHYDNVKGKLAEEIAEAVSKLDDHECLDLAAWWWKRLNVITDEAAFNDLAEQGKLPLIAGFIAEDDVKAKSSVSWQDTILRSVESMMKHETQYRDQLQKVLNRLYGGGATSPLMNSIFVDKDADRKKRLIAAAFGMQGANPKRVNHIVFGAGMTMPTKYCDQVEMPEGYVVMDKSPNLKDPVRCEDDLFDVVTVTGQPQLYHHCIVTAKVIDKGFLGKLNRLCKKGANDYNSMLEDLKLDGEGNAAAQQFFNDFKIHLKEEEDIDVSGSRLMAIIRNRLRAIVAAMPRSPNLIWMAKKTQDRLQRDSDGDRILVSGNRFMVLAALTHEEAIKGLPMPKVEVSKDTPYDGDIDVINAPCFSAVSHSQKMKHYNYICAPMQGQGPTGFLVNLCSTVLAHIVWNDVNGQWGPDPKIREDVLKLYAFLILLVQNSLDRQKKPWEVCSLLEWFLIEGIFEKILTGGKDYSKASVMREGFHSMKVGEDVEFYYTRENTEEQYNIPALKMFVVWALNFVKAGYEFNTPKQWSEDMHSIAKILSGVKVSEDGVEGDIPWGAIKEILGGHLDVSELETGWIWPDRLYGWKKEASLTTPLYDAPSALIKLSEWVVEENTFARERFGLDTSPDRVLCSYFKKLEAAYVDIGVTLPHTWVCVKAAKSLFMQYNAAKRDQYKDISQSEFYQARGDNDANTFLDFMKKAVSSIEDMKCESYSLIANALLNYKLKDDDKKSRNVTYLTLCLYKAWVYEGVQTWLDLRKPLEGLARRCAVSQESPLLTARDALLEDPSTLDFAMRVVKDLKLTTASDHVDNILEGLTELLAEAYRNDESITPLMIQQVDGVGNAKVKALNTLVNSIIPTGDNSHWSEVIWAEWFPALDVHLQMAENDDIKRRFFVEEQGIQSVMALVQQGDDNEIYKMMGTIFNLAINSFLKENSDMLKGIVRNDEEWFAAWNLEDMTSDEQRQFIIGAAIKSGNFLKMRDLMSIGAPVMQALRLRDTVNYQNLKTGGADNKLTEWLEANLISKSYYTTRDGDNIVTSRLNGRIEYPVNPDLTIKIASGLLKQGVSFYLLQETYNLWISKQGNLNGGKGLTPVKRWIAHDSLQYKIDGHNPSAFLKEEIATKMGIGSAFSINELALLARICTSVIKSGNDSDGMASRRLDLIKAKLVAAGGNISVEDDAGKLDFKLLEVEEGNYAGLDYDTNSMAPDDYTIAMKLADRVRFPYHWGGNLKVSYSPWGVYRSSIYRVVWRFIMNAIPEGYFCKDAKATLVGNALMAKRSQLFNLLTGSDLRITRGVKVTNETNLDQALAGLSFGNSSNESKSSHRTPVDNPTGGAVLFNGQVEWQKIQSGVNERVGHVVYDYGFNEDTGKNLIIETGLVANLDAETPHTLFVPMSVADGTYHTNDYLTTLGISEGRYVRELLWIMDSICNATMVSLNGMRTAGATIRLILECVSRDDAPASIRNAPRPALKELVLGLMHTTSLVDSYVMANWSEHNDRIGFKTPQAIRKFLRTEKQKVVSVLPSFKALSKLADSQLIPTFQDYVKDHEGQEDQSVDDVLGGRTKLKLGGE